MEWFFKPLKGFEVFGFGLCGDNGAFLGDGELVGDVLSCVYDVCDAGLFVCCGFLCIYTHLACTVGIEDVVGFGVVIGDDELFGNVDQVGSHGGVYDACYTGLVEDLVFIGSYIVGFLRVDYGLPFPVFLDDPCFVWVWLPCGEFAMVEFYFGVLVPFDCAVVLDFVEVGFVYGYIKGECDLVVEWEFAFVGGSCGCDGVLGLIPFHGVLVGYVFVVGGIGDFHVADGVFYAVGVDVVGEFEFVSAFACVGGDGGGVYHLGG